MDEGSVVQFARNGRLLFSAILQSVVSLLARKWRGYRGSYLEDVTTRHTGKRDCKIDQVVRAYVLVDATHLRKWSVSASCEKRVRSDVRSCDRGRVRSVQLGRAPRARMSTSRHITTSDPAPFNPRVDSHTVIAPTGSGEGASIFAID